MQTGVCGTKTPSRKHSHHQPLPHAGRPHRRQGRPMMQTGVCEKNAHHDPLPLPGGPPPESQCWKRGAGAECEAAANKNAHSRRWSPCAEAATLRFRGERRQETSSSQTSGECLFRRHRYPCQRSSPVHQWPSMSRNCVKQLLGWNGSTVCIVPDGEGQTGNGGPQQEQAGAKTQNEGDARHRRVRPGSYTGDTGQLLGDSGVGVGVGGTLHVHRGGQERSMHHCAWNGMGQANNKLNCVHKNCGGGTTVTRLCAVAPVLAMQSRSHGTLSLPHCTGCLQLRCYPRLPAGATPSRAARASARMAANHSRKATPANQTAPPP